MLRENPNANVRVFVVWEPVLSTDWGTPSATLTANIADRRAIHLWDRERALSAAYGDAPKLDVLADLRKVSFRMKDVVWDTALLYPVGAKWGSPAKLLVAPVFKYRDDLASTLSR